MESTRHPFRRFVFSEIQRHGEGAETRYAVSSPRSGRSVRLTQAELELARLFDGSRDARAISIAAHTVLGVELDREEIERFAHELTVAGLLTPGTQEPLPVPPQTDVEMVKAGWTVPKGSATPPPSLLPGSLAGPGRQGSLTGLWGVFRGQAQPLLFRLPLWPWLWIGQLLAWTVGGPIRVAVTLTLVFGAIVGVYENDGYAGYDLVHLLVNLLTVLLLVPLAIWLCNLVGQLARAAAIRRWVGVQPVFGLQLGFGFIPRFHTETAGVVEDAPYGVRLRIIGVGLMAQLVIFLLGVVGWLMLREGNQTIPGTLLGLGVIAMMTFLLIVNPLTRRDGYYLLAYALRIPDLREQAFQALFGGRRPWPQQKPPPLWALWLYAGLMLVYLATVILFLLLFWGAWFLHWGGIAVVVFLLVMGYVIYSNWRRASSQRQRVGEIHLRWPSQFEWAIVISLAVVALLPWDFEPSGEFVVLPEARADVRAQTAGDVRKVLVHEGEEVHKGELIARLSDDTQVAAVAAAKASIQQLDARLALVNGGHKSQEIDLAKQQVEVAKTRYKYDRMLEQRLAKAHERKAISDQDYDKAKQAEQVAYEQYLTAQRNLALVQSPAQPESVKELLAQISRARSALDLARQQLAATKLRAPIDGRVVAGSLQFAVGDYMHVGDLLARIEKAHQVQIQILLPESQIGMIKVGNEGYAGPWAYPYRTFDGRIIHIAPSAEASQNGRVVRVIMSVPNNQGLLKPEMTGYAKIESGTYPVIVVFTRAIVRFLLVEVWAWLP
jgi:Multidrug resistance efflux pump